MFLTMLTTQVFYANIEIMILLASTMIHWYKINYIQTNPEKLNELIIAPKYLTSYTNWHTQLPRYITGSPQCLFNTKIYTHRLFCIKR